MERWMARCMARASLLSLCALAISLTCFLGVVQWRSVIKREVDSAHRGSKQFEHLYREALDHSAQWKEQFDRERDRALLLERESNDALAQVRRLQAKAAEGERLLNSLVEARAKLINEVAAAQALARDRGNALADLQREQHAQGVQLEEARTDLQAAVEALRDQKAALEECEARIIDARDECDLRVRRLRERMDAAQDGRAQVVHDGHAQEVVGKVDINGVITRAHGGAPALEGEGESVLSQEAGKLVVEDVARHGSARRGSETIRPEDLPHVAEHAKHWRERGAGLKKGAMNEEISGARGSTSGGAGSGARGGGAGETGEARDTEEERGDEGTPEEWRTEATGGMQGGGEGLGMEERQAVKAREVQGAEEGEEVGEAVQIGAQRVDRAKDAEDKQEEKVGKKEDVREDSEAAHDPAMEVDDVVPGDDGGAMRQKEGEEEDAAVHSRMFGDSLGAAAEGNELARGLMPDEGGDGLPLVDYGADDVPA